ncbi:MAG: autotransporter domain-containing protein [Deltaproteobacteria bacterium]|nr:autotransporter domain-containing protein [Deltaproteobacteria bacterium]
MSILSSGANIIFRDSVYVPYEFVIRLGTELITTSNAPITAQWFDAYNSYLDLGASVSADEIYLVSSDMIVREDVTIAATDNIDLAAIDDNFDLVLSAGSKLDAGNRVGVGALDGNVSRITVQDTTSSNHAVIEAERYFAIMDGVHLTVNEDDYLDINLGAGSSDADKGVFVMGEIENDLLVENTDNTPIDAAAFIQQGYVFGGELDMRAGSVVTVDGRAYFGKNATASVGHNTLTVTGDAWFKDGSTIKLSRDATSSGKVVVGGITTIEAGAKLLWGDIQSTEVNAGNKTVLTSGGFANANVFTNPIFSFQQSGNDIVVKDYLGVGNVVEDVASAGGASVTGNESRAVALIDALIGGIVSASSDLVSRLIQNVEAISELAEAGSPGALVSLKQLIGEEPLPYIEAHHQTLLRQNRVVAKRRDFLIASAAETAPAAGYNGAANRLWFSGFGNYAKQKDGDEFGYRYSSTGLIFGYDREIVPGFTLGVNGAFSVGNLKNNDRLAETDVRTASFGLYGLYQFDNGAFLHGNVGFGWSDYDATIYLGYINATKAGTFKSRSFSVGLGGGYRFNLADNVSLTPTIDFEYAHIRQDGWRERIVSDPNNQAIANWFGDMSRSYLDIDLSVKLESVHRLGSAIVKPEIHAGVIFTPHSRNDDLRVGFTGTDGTLTLHGLEPGRTRFKGGLGLKAQLNDNVDLGFTYELELRNDYVAHFGQLGLGISF